MWLWLNVAGAVIASTSAYTSILHQLAAQAEFAADKINETNVMHGIS